MKTNEVFKKQTNSPHRLLTLLKTLNQVFKKPCKTWKLNVWIT